MCFPFKDEGKPYPLKPGSATGHSGQTLHFSRGNTTETHRRAFIVNFRPTEMVALERQKGFDHGKKVYAIKIILFDINSVFWQSCSGKTVSIYDYCIVCIFVFNPILYLFHAYNSMIILSVFINISDVNWQVC